MAQPFDEKSVFLAALALSPEDREGFLAGACEDEASRERIRELLRAHGSELRMQEAGDAPVAAGAPSRIAEFRIVRLLGEGATGRVYLAEDTLLGRKVALKLLSELASASAESVGRFLDEAKTAGTLDHPNIVRVHRSGSTSSAHFIASEYIDGPTVRAWCDDNAALVREAGPLGSAYREQAVRVVADIARALHHAHENGIVHRDVKPTNILLDGGVVPKLTDFGVALRLDRATRTQTGSLVGTCQYMSPEQVRIKGTDVDHRSDVFSLGIVLYELLAGRRPFEGATMAALMRAIETDQPVSLRSLNPTVPLSVQTICECAMEKQPGRRYQSAAAMADDLDAALLGDRISARPVGASRKLAAWWGRHQPKAWAAAAVSLLCAAALASWQRAAATDQQRAFVSVSYTGGQCSVALIEQDGRAVGARALGTTPIRSARLAPGRYRLRLEDRASDAWADMDVDLRLTGRGNEQRIVVFGPGITKKPSSSAQELAVVLHTDGEAAVNMVEVPGGSFGAMAGTEHPLLRVKTAVASFLIDTLEVTNGEYQDFLSATGHPAPPHWNASIYSGDSADLPVVMVSAKDAAAYAHWRGKRLPTLWEWQLAARGEGASLYPWGNEPPPAPVERPEWTSSNLLDDLVSEYKTAVAAADNAGRDVTPLGVKHMWSNVREYTSTPVPTDPNDVFVVGGAWSDNAVQTTLATVLAFPAGAPAPRHGFRCARSVRPADPR